jgi:hypothetical protein
LYLALLAAAVLCDWLLHLAGLVAVGRYFGIAGTALLLLSFVYSLRKWRWITVGAPKTLLAGHEVLGWVSALMLLVHAGIHLNAAVPWLAVAAMLAVVASGLTGKFLLARARADLAGREAELKAQGLPPKQIDRELLAQSVLVSAMKNWRKVHMPLTMVFVGLALLHVTSTLLLWGWR